MRCRGLTLLLACALALALHGLAEPALAGPVRGVAEARTALVIGNGAYKDAPLKNPVNDARDMAQALKALGFGVTLLTDATHQQMEAAVRDFGKTLRQGGVGLFYFAGHGVQVGGENFLVPVNAVIASESDVKFGCLNAGLVLGKMEDAGNGLNVIILDACRNNPFARSFRSAELGLAKMDAPTGSLIAYATAPGSVAADGAGRNGVYTEQILKHLRTPGLAITDLFMRVRMGVVAATGKKQVPWEASSLTGYFYFGGEAQPGQAPQPMPPLPAAMPVAPVPPALPRLDPKAERKRLADEAAQLRREQEELAQLQSIQAEQSRLELERQKLEQAKLLALAKRPQQSPANAPQARAHEAQFALLARSGLPDARAYFEQAVQARPDDADARAGLVVALVLSGREADAKYHLRRVDEAGLLTPGARLAKGLLLGLEGNTDAGYHLNRAGEEGADKALTLLCQAVLADRQADVERGRKLMENYAALVPDAERCELARSLDKGFNLLGGMVGSYRWVLPPAAAGHYQARLDISFTRQGKGLAATATGKFWAFSGDISVQDVQLKGKTLQFTLKIYKVLFGGLEEPSTYRFTCDLSGGVDSILVPLVEREPNRDGRFVPVAPYANGKLVRQGS